VMSSEWESLYGEVVWAKCPPFNWWPCYVYDPDKIPDTSEEVRKKASKLNGKQYAVYFYGDTSYSFTVPKNIVPYNEESKAKFAQTPPKRYATQFASGIEIADIEVALEKSKRVNFHLQGTGAINNSDSTVEPKKRGRPKKTDAKVGDDELYFVEPGQNKKKSTKRSNDEANGDDEDEEKQVTISTSQDSDVEITFVVYLACHHFHALRVRQATVQLPHLPKCLQRWAGKASQANQRYHQVMYFLVNMGLLC